MPSLEPCEKHEVSNCSFCTGADAAYEQSLRDPVVDRGLPPRIPGGPTIFARHYGRCTGCGRGYDVGDAIHYPRDTSDGWYGVACCF